MTVQKHGNSLIPYCQEEPKVPSTPPNLTHPLSGECNQNPADIANILNDFFVSVGKNMGRKIIPPQSNKTHIAKMNCESSFYLHETLAEEIMHVIDTLTEKNGRPTRQNDIPVKILKLCSEILSPFLAKLFNNCIKQGIYPQNFKCAQVTPIHKSGPENVCTNYRPISVLSPLNKIFEKLLYDRLYHYVECKSTLSKHQYGFRGKVSTEFTTYDIIECVADTFWSVHIKCCFHQKKIKSKRLTTSLNLLNGNAETVIGQARKT